MRTLSTLSALLLSFAASTALAAPVELKNDGFVSGMAAGFQAGFVNGEIGAVRLDPPGAGTYQITQVSLLFGGAATSQDVTLRIWTDTGNTAPGTQLFQGDYTLTGSDTAFSVIDLSTNNIMVAGSFRVGIEFQHDGLPSIARDDDGSIRTSHNFIMAQGLGWANSNLFGLTGDWIIRATVDGGGGTPDASVPDADVPDAAVPDGAVPDAGVPDADVPDANAPDAGGSECRVHSECPTGQYCADNDTCTYDCRVDYDCGNDMRCTSLGMCEAASQNGGGGGCGCQAPGAPSGGSWAGGLLVLGLALVLIRRRRRE